MLISLVLATLGNRKKEIIRLFDSLNEQTYDEFEVIVVSQCNHVLVEDILKNYSFIYKHIKIEKKGLSIARNEGLKYVNGRILTFTDDDCWYVKDAFEFIRNHFSNNRCELVCFQHFDPI